MNANDAAFPGGVNQVYADLDPGEPTQSGLTKRELFVLEMAKANRNRIGNMELPADKMANWAVADADALLAKLAEVKS